MLHDLRDSYIRRDKPSFFAEAAVFARHAAVWLAVSLAVTALAVVAHTYGAVQGVSDPAGYFAWATPGAG